MTIERALELLPQMRDSEWITVVGQVTAIYTDEAKEAFNMAISALEKQEQDKWISCKERLPENKKKVLVSYDTEDGKKVDVSMFDKYGCLLGLVFAWRPLPEPYTEEDND